MDRPDDARAARPSDRSGPASSGAPGDHLPPRVHAALDRLSARHRADPEPAGPAPGGAIVERLTGGKTLPEEVMAQILAKTDGVPLFVEELTKTVLESGLLRDGGDHRAVRPAAAARDPDDAPRLADGAPRSPGAGQGSGADRRRDRPRVLPRAARRGRRPARGRAAARAGSAGEAELVLRRGSGARRRATPSSMLWCRMPPISRCSRSAPAAACADRRGPGGALRAEQRKASPSCSPITIAKPDCWSVPSPTPSAPAIWRPRGSPLSRLGRAIRRRSSWRARCRHASRRRASDSRHPQARRTWPPTESSSSRIWPISSMLEASPSSSIIVRASPRSTTGWPHLLRARAARSANQAGRDGASDRRGARR